MSKEVRVFTPNPHFTGFRNAGRMSTEFKNGMGLCSVDAAKILVVNYGYLCPELYPEHRDRVLELHPRLAELAEEERRAKEYFALKAEEEKAKAEAEEKAKAEAQKAKADPVPEKSEKQKKSKDSK